MKFIKNLFSFIIFVVVFLLIFELVSWKNFSLLRSLGMSKQACNSLSYSWRKTKSRFFKFVDIAKQRVDEYVEKTEEQERRQQIEDEIDYNRVADSTRNSMEETIGDLENSIKELLVNYVGKEEQENKLVRRDDLENVDRKYVDVFNVNEIQLKQELQNVLKTTESLQAEQKAELKKEFEEMLSKNVQGLEERVNNLLANRINFIMRKVNKQMKSSNKTEADFDLVLSDTGFKSKFYDLLKNDLRVVENGIRDEMNQRIKTMEKLQDEYKEKVQSRLEVMLNDNVKGLEQKINSMVNEKLVSMGNHGIGIFSGGKEVPAADFIALLESKLSTTEARLKEMVGEKVKTLKKKIKKLDQRSKYLGQKMIEQEEEIADRLVQDEVQKQISSLKTPGAKNYRSKMKTTKKASSRIQFLADLIESGT